MGKRKVGRPTKATPERIEAILREMALGLTQDEACAVNGVSISTFQAWKTRPEHPDLSALAKGVRLKALMRLMAEQGKNDWRSTAWMIEKLYKDRFGSDAQVNVFAQQNNYQLSEQDKKEIQARTDRLLAEIEHEERHDCELTGYQSGTNGNGNGAGSNESGDNNHAETATGDDYAMSETHARPLPLSVRRCCAHPGDADYW